MMSWMPMSASQPAQFPCDVPVQLFTPPVAVAPSPFSAGQRRAEARDVVAQYVVNVLPVRRCLLEQPQRTVEDRHQVAPRETRERGEVRLDLLPRRPEVGRQRRGPDLESLVLPGEIAA